MATTTTRNLKLRVDSNLTANSKYNLDRLDLLGGTFLVDSTNTLRIRSQTDILLQPNSTELDGSGIGGTLNVGAAGQLLAAVQVYSSQVNFSTKIGLGDQATGGTRNLQLQYKSDILGPVDTVADRFLSVDLSGADRQIVLSGNLTTLVGDITLNSANPSAVTLPSTGTLATLAGAEVLTNKTIDAGSNTISNLRNANINASAAIDYSKLNLAASIQNSDIVPAAGISYSKLALSNQILNTDIVAAAGIPYSKLTLTNTLVNSDISTTAAISGGKVVPAFGSQVVSTTGGLLLSHGGFTTLVGAANSGQISNIAFNLPPSTGSSGQVLVGDGMGNLDWLTVLGTGTVMSVGLAASPEFVVSGSPVTTSGTLSFATATQSANTVWAGPTSGGALQPTFRSLVGADLPTFTPSRALVADPSGVIVAAVTTSTEIGFLSGVTSSIQTQFSGTQPLDSDLTALAALGTTGIVVRTGSGTVATRTLVAGTGISLANADGVSGDITINATSAFSKATWITADGATKTVTHNLGTTDVLVQVYDIASGATIYVDSVVRTDNNTLTLTASVAPGAGSWRVLIESLQ